MDPSNVILTAAAEAQSGMPGIPGSVEAAGQTIVTQGGILGALLLLSVFINACLLLIIRNESKIGREEKKGLQDKINDINEKRVAETKSSAEHGGDVELVLSKASDGIQQISRTLEMVGTGMRDLSSDTKTNGALTRDALARVEARLEALSSKIDRPLVPNPDGTMTRRGGGAS